MATRHVDQATITHEEQPVGALGGAPLHEPGPPAAEDPMATRKRGKGRKRAAKIRREAERPPDSFERFRVLAEVVDEGRQVVGLVDHKARYSLVVIGILNAGLYLLGSKSHSLDTVALWAQPWLAGSLIAYAFLTFLFVYFAVDCMRPRRLRDLGVMTASGDRGGPPSPHAPQGVLFWESIAAYPLDAYQRAWSMIRMDQINAEAVILAHQEAQLIRAKYVVLGRLYRGLEGLVVLAGVLLGMYTLVGLVG